MKKLGACSPILFFCCALQCGAAGDWRDQGILYLNSSPNAKLHPVPVHAVKLGAGFWSQRRRVTVEKSIPVMLDLLEEHGIVDNFRRLSGRKNVPRRGPLYTDSDLYKWMEAVAYALQSNETTAPDKHKLRLKFDGLVAEVLAAQEPSGYLNTYYTGDRVALRFTEMHRSHELYCLGHLLQAGIAYYRATGNRRLLDGAIKFVDYLVANFGPHKRPLLTGHPELEMALVELYRTTGNNRYLELARYLLSGTERERLKLKESDLKYMFSGKPFTARTEFEGHAVRAMYAASGATDYYAEAGDPAYHKTLETLWTDLTRRKMYITGGVGSRAQGEAFGDPWELPNAQAYTESCAAIGNFMWNFRMLAVMGESRFTDVMETALYNGINSGMSLSGTLYCYRNPLASNGEKIRNPWYDTTCCPPNLERILTSLPGYFYSTSRDGIYANLFHNSELDWHLEDGTGLRITETTDYPWDGEVKFTMNPSKPDNFTFYLRVPDWAPSYHVTVNGENVSTERKPGAYVAIERRWQAGDTLTLSLPMQPRMMVANPKVRGDYGRVAIARGPLVYAMEQMDQNGASLGDLAIQGERPISAEFHREMLGGILVLKYPGMALEHPATEQPLYEPLGSAARKPRKPVTLTLIPYYAWANREPTPMEVWIPAALHVPREFRRRHP